LDGYWVTTVQTDEMFGVIFRIEEVDLIVSGEILFADVI
jgi:hypothetical protein